MEEMRARSEGEWRQRVEVMREELRNSLSQALAEKDASTTEARRYKVPFGGPCLNCSDVFNVLCACVCMCYMCMCVYVCMLRVCVCVCVCC